MIIVDVELMPKKTNVLLWYGDNCSILEVGTLEEAANQIRDIALKVRNGRIYQEHEVAFKDLHGVNLGLYDILKTKLPRVVNLVDIDKLFYAINR